MSKTNLIEKNILFPADNGMIVCNINNINEPSECRQGLPQEPKIVGSNLAGMWDCIK
jgi:hypothetical protein